MTVDLGHIKIDDKKVDACHTLYDTITIKVLQSTRALVVGDRLCMKPLVVKAASTTDVAEPPSKAART